MIQNVSVDSTALQTGDSTTVRYDVRNLGPGTSPTSTAGIYLSTNSVISTGDTLLASQSANSLGANAFDGEAQGITLPGNLAPGTYWLGVVADYNGTVTEGNEGNNASSGVQITVTAPPSDPDLVIQNVSVDSTAVDAGGAVNISYVTANIGSGSFGINAVNRTYLSDDNAITTDDMFLIGESSLNLDGGTSQNRSLSLAIPDNIAPGTYFLGVIGDYSDRVAESNEANNVSTPIQITVSASVTALEGTSAGERLNGTPGNDVINARGGDDFVRGFEGDDFVSGGAGNDRLYGDQGEDTLRGGVGEDRLAGGGRSDILDGGSDRDVLTGQGGVDHFVFEEGDFAGTGGATSDRIVDFGIGGKRDIIDLVGVDAIAGGADDSFEFVGYTSFSGASGELRAVQYLNHLRLFGDTDGDRVADFAIRVDGTIALTESDFLL